MIFSSPVQHAIRAMTYLGQQETGKLSSIREISRAADVPLPYLAKIVNRLSRRRLVRARRGPSGGVMLGRPARQITVKEIIEAVGGELRSDQCILGLPECGDQAPCPFHERWKLLRQLLHEELHRQTVGDLVRLQSRRVRARPAG